MENLEGKFANQDHYSLNRLWEDAKTAGTQVGQVAGDLAAASISQPFNVLGIDIGQDKLFSSRARAQIAASISGIIAKPVLGSVGLGGLVKTRTVDQSDPIPVTLPIATNDTLIADNHNMVLIVAGVILLIILIAS